MDLTTDESYIRTDLAAERACTAARACSGASEYRENINGFDIHDLRIRARSAELPPPGRYITVTLGRLWLATRERAADAASTVSLLLRRLICGHLSALPRSVLTVCLGNRRITSDAVGPLCAEELIVTRHLKTEAPEIYRGFGCREHSVIIPGVVGDTGIETSDMIRSAVRSASPELVIAVDALAARSSDRLATALQLSDVGISPGSGVNNRRTAIDRETLGVPVISVGAPTVVHSSTLVWDALKKAGVTHVPPELQEILENEKSFFVTPKEADIAVAAQAQLISSAINLTLFGIPRI